MSPSCQRPSQVLFSGDLMNKTTAVFAGCGFGDFDYSVRMMRCLVPASYNELSKIAQRYPAMDNVPEGAPHAIARRTADTTFIQRRSLNGFYIYARCRCYTRALRPHPVSYRRAHVWSELPQSSKQAATFFLDVEPPTHLLRCCR